MRRCEKVLWCCQCPSGIANDANGMPMLDKGESRPLRLSPRLPWRLRPLRLPESTVLPDWAVGGRVTDARDFVRPGGSGYTTLFGTGASAYRAPGVCTVYTCVSGTTGGAASGLAACSCEPKMCASDGRAWCACSGLRRCSAVSACEDDCGEASVDCKSCRSVLSGPASKGWNAYGRLDVDRRDRVFVRVLLGRLAALGALAEESLQRVAPFRAAASLVRRAGTII